MNKIERSIQTGHKNRKKLKDLEQKKQEKL